MILPGLVRIERLVPDEPEPEDIFGSALNTLFQGDLLIQHGDAESQVIYISRFGDLKFRLADVNTQEERRKFAHYLWNAGILMGELLGGYPGGSVPNRDEDTTRRSDPFWTHREFDGGKLWWLDSSEEKIWRANGHSVLELGAGVGLAGITSILGGARESYLTDYPSDDLIKTLTWNVQENIPRARLPDVHIKRHLWGDLDSEFAKSKAHGFTRVLAADTLWMEQEHSNLLRSMSHFLAISLDSRVLVIAGFHTGRAKILHFFEIVEEFGLEIATIFEMDMNGNRRTWSSIGAESISENRCWLVVSMLKWKTECL